MKISVSSLGCRLNQAEIQSIISILKESGHSIVRLNEADLCIVNTCVVTHTSERKTRKLIYQAKRTMGENGNIIVTGCFVKALERRNNTIYVSNDFKYLIPEIIKNNFIIPDVALAPSRFSFPPATQSIRTRINLKVQDGCNNYCSYCIIPFVRGKPASKPLNDIIIEFRKLLDAGYREFLLTGIQIGMYKSATASLSDMIGMMMQENGSYRIHLSSLSPKYVTPALLDILQSDKIVKHLHLSLQSGSNSVLSRMNRGYTAEEFINIVTNIRKSSPLFNFTTDLIVGFPGESEKEFAESMHLIKEVQFSHVHTFRFSRREGTKAAEMVDSVPENVKKERSKRVIELYSEIKREYYSKFHNTTSTLLTEKALNGETTGFNEYYIPVFLQEESVRNRFIQVNTLFDDTRMALIGTRA